MMEDSEGEIITIHIDNINGETVSKIEVPLSELVELYMNTHYPIKNDKYLN